MKESRFLPRALSTAALALLFGAASAHAEGNKSRPADTSPGAAAQTEAGTSAASTTGASTSGASEAGVGQLSEGEQKILRDIAQANLAEIELSELALERTQDPEIRQFAQRMIEDHKVLNERVAYLARVKDVKLPEQPDRQHQQLKERLSQMEGEQFDNAYRQRVAERAHEKTYKMLQQAQVQADDPQLIALITQAIPLIGEHQTLAEDISPDGTRATGGTEPGAGAAGQPDATSQDPAGSGAAPSGASGASMSSPSSGADSGAAGDAGSDAVTSGSSNMTGPGKQ